MKVRHRSSKTGGTGRWHWQDSHFFNNLPFVGACQSGHQESTHRRADFLHRHAAIFLLEGPESTRGNVLPVGGLAMGQFGFPVFGNDGLGTGVVDPEQFGSLADGKIIHNNFSNENMLKFRRELRILLFILPEGLSWGVLVLVHWKMRADSNYYKCRKFLSWLMMRNCNDVIILWFAQFVMQSPHICVAWLHLAPPSFPPTLTPYASSLYNVGLLLYFIFEWLTCSTLEFQQ